MNIYSKMKLVMLSAYLISMGGLFFYFSWTGIYIALIMWVLYTIGVSGGYHKLLSHKQFKTGDTFKYFLIFLGTISGLGSSIAWVSQHRLHHRHPDVKGLDPYYPQEKPILTGFHGFWPVKSFNLMIVKDLMRDPIQMFIHNHYFTILMTYIIILFVIEPQLVIYMWALPCTMYLLCVHFGVGVFGHGQPFKVGWRDHDLDDNSINSHVMNIFTLGESYQNTHHYEPTRLVCGRYDMLGYLMRVISK